MTSLISDLMLLSVDVYNPKEVTDLSGLAPAGWNFVESVGVNGSGRQYDPESGFYAYAVTREGSNGAEVVIAFRGTDGLNGDFGADWALSLGSTYHPQFEDALQFTLDVMQTVGLDSEAQVYLAGHSLGGALAQISSSVFGLPGYTFDAPGMLALSQNQDFQSSLEPWFTDNTDRLGLLSAYNPQLNNPGDLVNISIVGSVVSSVSGEMIGSEYDLVTDQGSSLVGAVVEGLSGLGVSGGEASLLLLSTMAVALSPAAALAAAGVIGGDSYLKHQSEAIRSLVVGLDQQGQLIPKLIESTHFPSGIEGYDPSAESGLLGTLGSMLGSLADLFRDQLSQADAVDLLERLSAENERRSGPLAEQFEAAIDHLKIATQTLTESQWSESKTTYGGYRGELELSIARAPQTRSQLLTLDLPGVNSMGEFSQLAVVGATHLDWSSEGYRLRTEPGSDKLNVQFQELSPYVPSLSPLGSVPLVYQLYGREGTDTEAEVLALLDNPSSRWFSAPSIDSSSVLDEENPWDLMGDDFNNRLTGDLGENTLLGLGGDDELLGEGGWDTLIGGYGNDLLQGGEGRDLLIGGDGDDRLFAQDTETPIDREEQVGPDALQVLGDNLSGQEGDDLLIGGLESDLMGGGSGDDLIYGGGGSDYLFGDRDWAMANPEWSIEYRGRDVTIIGDHQGDTSRIVPGNDQIWGGGGSDYIWGGEGNDLLLGQAGNDYLGGEAGDDSLLGGAGDDTLHGGAGNDLLVGGSGLNRLNGDGIDTPLEEQGDDLIIGGDERDLIWGDGGDDRLYGNGGNDQIQGDNTLGASGDDYLSGGKGGDYLLGQLGNDELHGDEGDDALVGGAGNDRLYGGEDNDRLQGDAGDDYLHGGSGHDWLIGGEGYDVLVAGSGQDELTDTLGGGLLIGEEGYDTYDIRVGQDAVSIMDREENRLKFGDLSYAQGMNRISLSQGSLLISIDGQPIAHLINFDPNDVYAGSGISDFQFSDGVSINYLQLLQLGIDNQGSDANDSLWGTNAFDRLMGYGGDDSLYGLAGDDILDGGSGADRMLGMEGDDQYQVDNPLDRVEERAGEGVDRVDSLIDYQLPEHVEHLSLQGEARTGVGNAQDNLLQGNELDNHLIGGAGNDSLVGGQGNDHLDGGDGADTLAGGLGDDLYRVDDPGDQIHELPESGDDHVLATTDHRMSLHVERLTMLGESNLTAWGSNTDNLIEGNGADNQLFGEGGNDSLYGGAGSDLIDGGTGSDLLVGGEGNDRFRISDLHDRIIEQAEGGIDRVELFVEGYRLENQVEELVLRDGVFSALGNELDNLLIGNDLSNHLDGGSGADRMQGGIGNDHYIIDNTGDRVVEYENEGDSDWLETFVDYSLPDYVENLKVASPQGLVVYGNGLSNRMEGNRGGESLFGGDGDDRLYGYAGDDRLDGGSGNDLLDGGQGADWMRGGQGDDQYRVDNALDRVEELAGEGLDRVVASISYQLTSGVEELELVGWSPIDGVGNELGNLLIGNDHSNHLQGLEGDDLLVGRGGADLLEGGVGDDTYEIWGAQEQVVEQADGGYDRVLSLGSYTLAGHLESLELVGSGIANGHGNAEDNRIIGNRDRNLLEGMAGSDWLDGGSGDDHLVGGSGDDWLLGGEDPDRVDTDEGWDSDPHSWLGPMAWSNSDRLEGGEGDDYLDGGSGDDLLFGGAGDDRLLGGADGGTLLVSGDPGAAWNPEWDNWGNEAPDWQPYREREALLSNNDQLWGGLGDDWLEGGSGNDFLDGGEGRDILLGGEGDDHLDGGLGIDRLAGGAGDDLYIVDGYRQERIEWVLLETPVERDLTLDCRFPHDYEESPAGKEKGNEGLGNGWDAPPPGHEVNLNDGVPYGPGNPGARAAAPGHVVKVNDGSDPFSSAGNSPASESAVSADLMSEDLSLNVESREGADVLVPALVVEWITDQVEEAYGAGYDQVLASVSFTLPDQVEALTLTGTLSIDATGNSLSNRLQGNSGDNRLDGAQGADWMAGGQGSDRYRVDHSGDQVIEWAAEGEDWVDAGIDYQLTSEVENLQLLGSEKLTGIGNELDNWLAGNDGDNRLLGGEGNDRLQGGRGDDLLQGGGGDDRYHYRLGDGLDRIEDSQGGNRLVFGEGVDADEVTARYDEQGEALLFQITNEAGIDYLGQGLWLEAGSLAALSTVEFADGASMSWQSLQPIGVSLIGGNGRDELVGTRDDDLLEGGRGRDRLLGGAGYDQLRGGSDNDLLAGGEGADQLWGEAGDDLLLGGCGSDLLVGGEGMDRLVGGAGDDRYLFSAGFGQDQLEESTGAEGGQDRVIFGDGISKDRLFFARQETDLLVSVLDSNDRLLVKGWYAQSSEGEPVGHSVERFETDSGWSLQQAQVDQLVQAMAMIVGAEGSVALGTTHSGGELAAEIAAAWQPPSAA
ncbi:hypothetical protein [Aestuariirhabdus litorea]|uniref:DUF2974 domain-containing protein n=1 Tax=Aestuariirhabdus litorea TaxID=2528527 RepID=A0A3P3VRA7_9GAMM|nr:hypothetical protein [Aestuariirhabdus litorea]RRJ84508.1 hypothetical protein D0544_05220 [Aestuariirhabdus litorea]RWW97733.1 hypothetical protein DZC74_05215 [Endozoicomonadaceae bacterium GTF-13]